MDTHSEVAQELTTLKNLFNLTDVEFMGILIGHAVVIAENVGATSDEINQVVNDTYKTLK